MGSTFKIHIYYERSFWREKGLCGATFISASDQHPVAYTMDDTKPDGSLPALTGFIVGEQARKLCSKSAEERKNIVTKSLAKIFQCDEALEASVES